MSTVYLNGEYLPKERATVSVDDRGFLLSDGLYEGSSSWVKSVTGRLFLGGPGEDGSEIKGHRSFAESRHQRIRRYGAGSR